MASDNKGSNGNEFIKVMDTFPCLFNIGLIQKPNRAKMYFIKTFLNVDTAKDESFEGQRVKDLNVLSWLNFQIGDIDKAMGENDDALCVDTDDLVTLGNRAFLEWFSGSPLSTFLDHLEKLKLKADFPEKRLDAKSTQAYMMLRLGGIYNLSSAITIYNDLLKANPENYEWKYFMCLARRRFMVKMRKFQDEEEIEQTYIAENASEAYFKRAAMYELVHLLASVNGPARVVEDLIQRILLSLSEDSPVALRKCGIALSMISNTKGIDLLEESADLRGNMQTQHSLAKSLINFRLTRNRNRQECDRKAALNFKASYESSCKENVWALVDLAYLYLNRDHYDESLDIFTGLIQNWFVGEVYQNPFMLSKILRGWYQSLKKTGGKIKDPQLERHLSITISVSLDQFKRYASPHDQSSIFDVIVSPDRRMSPDRSVNFLLELIRDCVSCHSAVQKLMKLNSQGNLECQQLIEKEIELLLQNDQSGEAVLMLDILELQSSRPGISRILQDRAMLQEAKWQLNEGLISCKLLFHKLFNTRHSHSSLRTGDCDEPSPAADVLIFQDGHHWKPFLKSNSDQSTSDEGPLGTVNQNRMVEDVITNLCDLETTTNPWLPFSCGNRPDVKEFFAMLRHFKVRLVLLVVDADTSNGFLQMADFLLSQTHEAEEADVAIVYTEDVEDTTKNQMPTLSSRVRCFKANDRGFQHRADSKSVTDLVGTEILDAYFSGKVDNAIDFFQFLAPTQSE